MQFFVISIQSVFLIKLQSLLMLLAKNLYYLLVHSQIKSLLTQKVICQTIVNVYNFLAQISRILVKTLINRSFIKFNELQKFTQSQKIHGLYLGWRLYPENPLKSGFGSLSASDDDYAGLYSLNGEPDKTYTAGMHKIYDNIPPHSFLIINVKTLISNYGQGGLGAIVIRANGAVIMNEENPLDIVNNYKKTSFQLPFISSSPSVIIEFLFSVKNIIRTLTFGFREFELYYKKCPAGCLFCQTKDLKSSDCNLWSLGHRSLADSNPLNEGWLINFQGQNIYNTEYCQDDKAINLIGLASSTQSIEKTVHLKPHYKMIIQYKLLLLGAESSMYTYFNLELNDIVVSDIKIATYTEGSKVCKFRNPISYGDYILQTSYENFHQDTGFSK